MTSFKKLLDDGSGRDPLETYNFGKAANYLFRPCMNEDGTPDEVRKPFTDWLQFYALILILCGIFL